MTTRLRLLPLLCFCLGLALLASGPPGTVHAEETMVLPAGTLAGAHSPWDVPAELYSHSSNYGLLGGLSPFFAPHSESANCMLEGGWIPSLARGTAGLTGAARLSLRAYPGNARKGSTVTLIAQLEDAEGEPVEQAGVPVTFSKDTGTISAPSMPTDRWGRAIVSWTVATRTVAHASASSPGLNGADTAAVFTNDPAAIWLTVTPNAIPADGTSTALLTAKVVDDAATPSSGYVVAWQPQVISLAMAPPPPAGLVDIIGDNPQATVQGEARWASMAKRTAGTVTLTATAPPLQQGTTNLILSKFTLTLPASTSAAPGDQVTLPVAITGVGGLAGLQATITYPDATFAVMSVDKGSLLVDRPDWTLSWVAGPGKVTFLLTSLALDPLAQANGELAQIVLRILPSVPFFTHVPVAFGSAKCVNALGASILTETTNGEVYITSRFDDVPVGSSCYDYVQIIAQRGITGGCQASPPLYCPYAPVTRAQMAKFLCLAAGKAPLTRSVATFCDVPKSSWAYGYVERLADAGSWGGNPPTSGCRISGSCKYFCPFDNVTREQMAKFLCVATGRAEAGSCTGAFCDVPSGNAFCKFIERLTDAPSWPGSVAVTSGCVCPAGTASGCRCYCPKASVTRCQMSAFLCRAFGLH